VSYAEGGSTMSAANLIARLDAAKGDRQRASDLLAEVRGMGSKEKPQREGLLDQLGGISGIGHTVLDVAGLIPVVGTAADLINAGWYAAEGDWRNAGLSALGAVPGIGDAATVARVGARGLDTAASIARNADNATDTAQTARNTENFRDFAHGSHRDHVVDIVENGLDVERASELSQAGRANQSPGSFFTIPLSGDGQEGLQYAADFGARVYGPDTEIAVMRVPESVFQGLEASGAAYSRSIPGIANNVTETIFRPESFEALNQYATFERLIPGG